MCFTLFEISKEISTKSLNFEGKSYSLFHDLLKKSRFFLYYECTFKILKIMDNEILLKLKQNMESETKVIKCQTKEKPIPKYNSQTGMWEIKMDGTRIILDF